MSLTPDARCPRDRSTEQTLQRCPGSDRHDRPKRPRTPEVTESLSTPGVGFHPARFWPLTTRSRCPPTFTPYTSVYRGGVAAPMDPFHPCGAHGPRTGRICATGSSSSPGTGTTWCSGHPSSAPAIDRPTPTSPASNTTSSTGIPRISCGPSASSNCACSHLIPERPGADTGRNTRQTPELTDSGTSTLQRRRGAQRHESHPRQPPSSAHSPNPAPQ